MISEQIINKLVELGTTVGLKILTALIIFLIGLQVAKWIKHLLETALTKKEVESTLVKFLGKILYIALISFVIIIALNQAGVAVTSIIAIFGAASLTVGLALQGSLSSLAAGISLIILRPFKIGDLIDGGGSFGIVEEIGLFNTTIKTLDNLTIIIPNDKIRNEKIINYSLKPIRRVDLVVSIGYGDDIDKAKQLVKEILSNDSRILADPAFTIHLFELADSSVNFAVRPWVKTSDYWDTYCDLTETIKKRFDEEGINIPFPQRDVHIYNHN
ncbi:mechanosensitive ion channel domain-containing protein [Cyanobacterium aponinum UTEX 3222]|uniref:MscS Mechanosensitive ion channel n=3 Tax=Cyanobacterium aponinum TaxID=379064 RepID=K9Z3D5_CYAAP|nr:mechanosensitive ion channel domain-containing protein [Cyanobacterium aponinum]WRL40817.1 mechanosensitive ion channel domain-containing protein [Cyanobacterium aponinum UTEX 3222]AFZ52888.1 MscS Mechanosensitive ion channel [Cyanobacterium aponinum PCC 10605]MBD2394321.1 mechanosensitive ion channel [Cyanobacterium aponinum FACHB-4101]MTF37806.1 mechanosensitive ion channel [Cyanobacterium aponinum 0216]PHV63147.1 mechanosensitive ion channel protein [Cyanobacterium aponinum IPPAS B-1201]